MNFVAAVIPDIPQNSKAEMGLEAHHGGKAGVGEKHDTDTVRVKPVERLVVFVCLLEACDRFGKCRELVFL